MSRPPLSIGGLCTAQEVMKAVVIALDEWVPPGVESSPRAGVNRPGGEDHTLWPTPVGEVPVNMRYLPLPDQARARALKAEWASKPNNIKQLCRRRGIPIHKLSAKIGISVGQLYLFVGGHPPTTPDQAWSVAAGLQSHPGLIWPAIFLPPDGYDPYVTDKDYGWNAEYAISSSSRPVTSPKKGRVPTKSSREAAKNAVH